MLFTCVMLGMSMLTTRVSAQAAIPSASPMISEFLARNNSRVPLGPGELLDEDGDASDWIELHNPSEDAIDLGAWCLTDDRESPTQWSFPPNVVLAPGEYLIVFASGKDRTQTDGPLHTNFRLDGDGEYLALIRPDGRVVQAFAQAYPPQQSGISYGIGLIKSSTPLIEDRAEATFWVPQTEIPEDWTGGDTHFSDAAWQAGSLGLGYGDVRTHVNATAYIVPQGTTGNQDYGGPLGMDFVVTRPTTVTALGVFDDRSDGLAATLTVQLWVRDDQRTPFSPQDDRGVFVLASEVFTSLSPGILELGSRFKALSVPVVLSPGAYTIAAHGYNSQERNGNSGASAPQWEVSDSDAAISFVGGARYGAQGSSGFPGTVDTGPANRYAAGTFLYEAPSREAFPINTLIQDAMFNVNAGVYVRIGFQVPDTVVNDYHNLRLHLTYNDGVVAYLNGVEVARRHAPPDLSYRSPATDVHTGQESLALYERALLHTGTNVLALHGLNVSVQDENFLIQATLEAESLQASQTLYFVTPTPGQENTSPGFTDIISDLHVSVERGFYDAPFDVKITTDTPEARIVFTLDGSRPSQENGFTYTAPLHIDHTTILRAAAFKEGTLPGKVLTHSYLFPDDIVQQPDNPPGFPAQWKGTRSDYGMSQAPKDLAKIAGDPATSSEQAREIIKQSLLALPTVSLCLAVDDLFGADAGIYANPTSRGLEQPVSLEYLNADGSPGFQIDAGLRLMGFTSRSPGMTPKHSLRVLFKSEYGAGRLRERFFPNAATADFNTMALRANARDAWPVSSRAVYIRDEWAKQAQRDMGRLATHGCFVHLYLNGLYWGVYNPTERPDAAFAATYLDGDDTEFDAVKFCCPTYAVDGTTDAWDQLWDLAAAGLAGPADLELIQGRAPDGTPDPVYDTLVDVDNLIDFMIAGQYHASGDWPGNWYGVRRRGAQSDGFQFVTWDNDLAFPGENIHADKTDDIDHRWFNFAPGHVDRALRENPEYRMRFADRVFYHYGPGGAYYVDPEYPYWDPCQPDRNVPASRWMALADLIKPALYAESARWGDASGSLFTPDNHWMDVHAHMLLNYFPHRSQVVIEQLRSRHLYPASDPPTFNQRGGIVPADFRVTLTASQGIIYYTLNNEDPRQSGGTVHPNALIYDPSSDIVLHQDTRIQTRLKHGDEWSALNTAAFTIDQNTVY
ncbi:MAG: CotH kinase family protein [Phycisphaerae bacterium]|nr:CotH kinase family protein [Phycisphaerae bacterium]